MESLPSGMCRPSGFCSHGNVALSLVLSSGSCSLGACAGGVGIRPSELCAHGVLAFRFQWILLTGSRCSLGLSWPSGLFRPSGFRSHGDVAAVFVSVQWSLLAWSRCSLGLVSATLVAGSSLAAKSNIADSTLVAGSSRTAGSSALLLDIHVQLLQVQLVPGRQLNAAGSTLWGRFLAGSRVEGNWRHACSWILTCIQFECSWFYLGLLTSRLQLMRVQPPRVSSREDAIVNGLPWPRCDTFLLQPGREHSVPE